MIQDLASYKNKSIKIAFCILAHTGPIWIGDINANSHVGVNESFGEWLTQHKCHSAAEHLRNLYQPIHWDNEYPPSSLPPDYFPLAESGLVVFSSYYPQETPCAYKMLKPFLQHNQLCTLQDMGILKSLLQRVYNTTRTNTLSETTVQARESAKINPLCTKPSYTDHLEGPKPLSVYIFVR